MIDTFCIIVLVDWVPVEGTVFFKDDPQEVGPEPAEWLAANGKLIATTPLGGQRAVQLIGVPTQ
jgi:hypothetical protein